ncbi:AAA family ATPase [Streptococcus gallolyticus]|uniref:AAA family ATPase n=1 Tax=Streptococcus gallolyticus TaxID=315405 RepID=UPI002097C52A|nr:AAA family ATPase [Streptococcus gallolyticus]MCO7177248.1 AAA family ATPase [Streptococcus gallolyticus]MCY7165002.1 AAA family ATPase [Streptococcus gallolyticus subsp. gallolyticus]MCY7182100.1 AAA family ATPase [Streptococcus gallolyticus subsp. gallolyticus]
MIETLELPGDIFAVTQLPDIKQKNFIYGKNGSGKSTIANEIIKQYADQYDVRVFQGFDSVAENSRLKAISLGRENAELQPQIEEVELQIKEIEAELSEDSNDNFYSKYANLKQKYEEHYASLKQFYKNSARTLKINYTSLTGPNYNTNDFQKDIPAAQKLSEENIAKLNQIISQKSMPAIQRQDFELINLSKYVEATNEILSTKLAKAIVLEFNSQEEQNWVRKGLKIHKHNSDSSCPFCKNEISSERLNDLNNFFGDKVNQFENRIRTALQKISSVKMRIENIQTMKEKDIYPKFHEEANQLNFEILEIQRTYSNFLDFLLRKLNEKLSNLFNSMDTIEKVPAETMKNLKCQYDAFCDKNDAYTQSLSNDIKQSREKLKAHQVALMLENFEYSSQIRTRELLKKDFDIVQREFEGKGELLQSLRAKYSKLISQTVDESYAAEEINNKLAKLGSHRFKLVLVDDEQKGQYIIKNPDGSYRNIETLSTGEKNIVSFLWFIVDLNNPEKSSEKNKVIVFDDPMNSNDDGVQYLIILQLQKLLKNLADNEQIFIMTHNIHFYLNVRYMWWRKNAQLARKSTLHIFKADGKSNFKVISSKEDDLMTSYQALWAELRWLYDQQKPDFMLNPIRRILETYLKFNQINSSDFYRGFDEIEKLFNVNSHSIDDIDDFATNANGKTPEEIIEMMRLIFKENNGESHFEANWKRGKVKNE